MPVQQIGDSDYTHWKSTTPGIWMATWQSPLDINVVHASCTTEAFADGDSAT